MKYNGDLESLEHKPTTDPLNLNVLNGINSKVSMLTVTVDSNKGI